MGVEVKVPTVTFRDLHDVWVNLSDECPFAPKACRYCEPLLVAAEKALNDDESGRRSHD